MMVSAEALLCQVYLNPSCVVRLRRSTGFKEDRVKALALRPFELVRELTDLVQGLERRFGS